MKLKPDSGAHYAVQPGNDRAHSTARGFHMEHEHNVPDSSKSSAYKSRTYLLTYLR